jgi:hypothetical protein
MESQTQSYVTTNEQSASLSLRQTPIWVGIRVQLGSSIFSSPHHPDRLLGSPSLLSNGYRVALFPGIKWQVCQGDQSLPTSAEVKKIWTYITQCYKQTLIIHPRVGQHGKHRLILLV